MLEQSDILKIGIATALHDMTSILNVWSDEILLSLMNQLLQDPTPEVVNAVVRNLDNTLTTINHNFPLTWAEESHRTLSRIVTASMTLKIFSRKFFKRNFITIYLYMGKDPVESIVVQMLLLIMPPVRKTLALPGDGHLLNQIADVSVVIANQLKSPWACNELSSILTNLSDYSRKGRRDLFLSGEAVKADERKKHAETNFFESVVPKPVPTNKWVLLVDMKEAISATKRPFLAALGTVCTKKTLAPLSERVRSVPITQTSRSKSNASAKNGNKEASIFHKAFSNLRLEMNPLSHSTPSQIKKIR
eukprot:Clim_evm47s225 gene=Clim_evmTU47s225